MERSEQEIIKIDFTAIVKRLLLKRKVLYKIIGIGSILGLVVAFSIPKTYQVKVTLSPESGKAGGNNMAAGMASMLGLGGLSAGIEQDALNVTLFPEIIKSSPFLLEIFNVRVKTLDDVRSESLIDYIDTQKSPWWNYIMRIPSLAISGVKSLLFETESQDSIQSSINPFHLTPKQEGKLNFLRRALKAEIDKKSEMTTIIVTFQDPLVAAIVADTAVAKLQEYITNYRIKKAKEDCEYLEKLCNERKQEYYDAQMRYAKFMDANRGMSLESVKIESERLQNATSITNQVYSQVETQLQVARAKVQEAKPVFAVVEPATVPLHASGPNKPLIFIAFIFLGFMAGVLWILWGEDLWRNIHKG